MSLAWIATFRARPSPRLVMVTLNSTGWPLRTFPVVGLATTSTLSLGSSTRCATGSRSRTSRLRRGRTGPVLVGLTLTLIVRSEPAASVGILKLRCDSCVTVISGTLEMYFSPSGSSSSMSTLSASEVPVFRTISLRVASWLRFMLAGACTSTVTATDCLPIGRRSTVAPDGFAAEQAAVRATPSAGGLSLGANHAGVGADASGSAPSGFGVANELIDSRFELRVADRSFLGFSDSFVALPWASPAWT